MGEHMCHVGVIWDDSESRVVTLDELKQHIRDVKAINRSLDRMHIPGKREEYSLLDYADKRRATDFARFDFCPKCGNKIPWEKIRRMRDA